MTSELVERKEKNGISDLEAGKQLWEDYLLSIIKNKYNIADEYKFVLSNIVNNGFDHTLELIDESVDNYLSYWNYYNCIPYFVKNLGGDFSEMKCKFATNPSFKNTNRAEPIIAYFKNKFYSRKKELPEVEYGKYVKLYLWIKNNPEIRSAELASKMYNGRCGKKEIDKINQMKHRLSEILK